MAAIGFNKTIMARRDLFLTMVQKEKGARERLKRLQPKDNLLFGGQVHKLTKALKEEDQVFFLYLFLFIIELFQLRPGRGGRGQGYENRGNRTTPGGFRGKSKFFRGNGNRGRGRGRGRGKDGN